MSAQGTAEPEPWWPSAFGANDQIGMLNHIDEAKRLAALSLVRRGQLFDLARVTDDEVPVFPGRHFRQLLVTTAHHVNDDGSGKRPGLGDNAVNWVIEEISATTQLGTHLDALNHLQIGDRGYNGWTVADLAETWGTNRLGSETIPQIVTRGWLVDAARVRGVPRLAAGDAVTVDDVRRALGDAADTVEPGDAMLFHTGWGTLWSAPDDYLAGQPGPGMELAGWLASRGVALTGCDTWSYGPVPPEDPARPFEVPQTLNVRHGVFVVENLSLGELAAAGVTSYALILSHPKLRGATGAWCSPVALI